MPNVIEQTEQELKQAVSDVLSAIEAREKKHTYATQSEVDRTRAYLYELVEYHSSFAGDLLVRMAMRIRELEQKGPVG